MNLQLISTVFITVFLAELGDKTQLATMLFSSGPNTSKISVFLGASMALVLSSALGVLLGSAIGQVIPEKTLHYLAGIGFILVGTFTLIKA